jgi:hypothetical protein
LLASRNDGGRPREEIDALKLSGSQRYVNKIEANEIEASSKAKDGALARE